MLKSQSNTQKSPIRGQAPWLCAGHCWAYVLPHNQALKNDPLNLSLLLMDRERICCWRSNAAECLLIGPIRDSPYGLYIWIHEERRAPHILCCSAWLTSLSSSNKLNLLYIARMWPIYPYLWHSAWTDVNKQTFSKSEKEVALIF